MKSFDWDRLAGQLPAQAWAGKIKYFESCESTQDEAAAWALQGAEEGDLILAERQTRGRGRWGRTWSSVPASGLLVSIILKPGERELSSLALALGLGLAEALDKSGLAAQLKWPNDIFVQGRKLAGLLAEQKNGAVIFGFGLNVSALPAEPELQASAISMHEVLNREIDREALLAAILTSLKARYDAWLAHGFESMKSQWLQRALCLGERVMAGEQRGVYEGLENNGALRLNTEAGLILIQSGELSSLRPLA